MPGLGSESMVFEVTGVSFAATELGVDLDYTAIVKGALAGYRFGSDLDTNDVTVFANRGSLSADTLRPMADGERWQLIESAARAAFAGRGVAANEVHFGGPVLPDEARAVLAKLAIARER